jgi:osomolarity two-component system response regulator SSK1
VLQVCRSGDTIELGLQIVTAGGPRAASPPGASQSSRSASPLSASISEELDGPLQIYFEIIHRFCEPPTYVPLPPNLDEVTMWPPQPEQIPGQGDPQASRTPDERAQPDFSSPLLSRLLRHIDADLSGPRDSANRCTATLSLIVPRGDLLPEQSTLTPEDEAARQPFPDLRLAS